MAITWPVHVFKVVGPAHKTNGDPCWCQPARICGDCLAPGPCIHGAGRCELIVHKEAN